MVADRVERSWWWALRKGSRDVKTSFRSLDRIRVFSSHSRKRKRLLGVYISFRRKTKIVLMRIALFILIVFICSFICSWLTFVIDYSYGATVSTLSPFYVVTFVIPSLLIYMSCIAPLKNRDKFNEYICSSSCIVIMMASCNWLTRNFINISFLYLLSSNTT